MKSFCGATYATIHTMRQSEHCHIIHPRAKKDCKKLTQVFMFRVHEFYYSGTDAAAGAAAGAAATAAASAAASAACILSCTYTGARSAPL